MSDEFTTTSPSSSPLILKRRPAVITIDDSDSSDSESTHFSYIPKSKKVKESPFILYEAEESCSPETVELSDSSSVEEVSTDSFIDDESEPSDEQLERSPSPPNSPESFREKYSEECDGE